MGPLLASFIRCNKLDFTPHPWGQKLGWNSQQVWSNKVVLFPCVPCACECLTLAGLPCNLAQIGRCNFIICHSPILLISWSTGWLVHVHEPSPCQSGCKIGTEPHTAPQNARLLAKVNDLNVKTNIQMRQKGLRTGSKAYGHDLGELWHGDHLIPRPLSHISLTHLLAMNCVHNYSSRIFVLPWFTHHASFTFFTLFTHGTPRPGPGPCLP